MMPQDVDAEVADPGSPCRARDQALDVMLGQPNNFDPGRSDDHLDLPFGRFAHT